VLLLKGFLLPTGSRWAPPGCISLREAVGTPNAALSAMAESVFNMDDGYFEGIIRGFRAGILKRSDYLNLCQCETLEGMYTCAHACVRSLCAATCMRAQDRVLCRCPWFAMPATSAGVPGIDWAEICWISFSPSSLAAQALERQGRGWGGGIAGTGDLILEENRRIV